MHGCLQAYEEQAAGATAQLQELEQQFQQAVAEIMELQSSPQLQAVIEEQQHLCDMHVGAYKASSCLFVCWRHRLAFTLAL